MKIDEVASSIFITYLLEIPLYCDPEVCYIKLKTSESSWTFKEACNKSWFQTTHHHHSYKFFAGFLGFETITTCPPLLKSMMLESGQFQPCNQVLITCNSSSPACWDIIIYKTMIFMYSQGEGYSLYILWSMWNKWVLF